MGACALCACSWSIPVRLAPFALCSAGVEIEIIKGAKLSRVLLLHIASFLR